MNVKEDSRCSDECYKMDLYLSWNCWLLDWIGLDWIGFSILITLSLCLSACSICSFLSNKGTDMTCAIFSLCLYVIVFYIIRVMVFVGENV